MKNLYDLIIIGAGSAGMTAGIYAGRSKLKTLVLDKEPVGGQIKITSEVVNYPGILRTSGAELAQTMRKQAESFGVEFLNATVLSVDLSQDIKKLITSAGEFEALGVIVATGSKPRTLGFEGEEAFHGRGIGYCATCDGEFFAGMDVFVIGAGFAAAEEAIYLTRYARKVTIIAREPEFTCSKTIADKVLAHPKIEVKFNTEILEVGGEKVLQYARFVNNQTGETWRYDVAEGDPTFGVFVFVGYIPQSVEYAGQLELDPSGYILTDENLKTNVDGVYAAGDIRPKTLRQLVTAVSDGALAATALEKYIAEKKEQLGIGREAESAFEPPAGPFFDEELKNQLTQIFARFQNPIGLVAFLDEASDWGDELKGFLADFAALTDRVRVEILNKGENPELEKAVHATIFPTFAILDRDGKYTGVQFHGIPGGHEINSFILALYNAAGPGQAIGEDILAGIRSVAKPVNLKIGVSLSCTLCPDVVAAAQLMALKNPLIEAEMIDIARFPEFKQQYSILSVPAIVVNDTRLLFGKKSLEELLQIAST
ncbi:thioredoxin reductase (NADPH) [Hydrogenispora ethanolica]|uniref:Thioredoxin reductase (NADPH) n=1 Tax=Hydrogenispora ethanolica TaxID=1082276 RepID=A0A4R1RZY8_HYDET|nr:FAD-dependent oxidoreductase [Hydrogenispora ethanolica]TCL72366.1 thioredoxin reductase (NADPH) [Hydrogenispora ethanolica]